MITPKNTEINDNYGITTFDTGEKRLTPKLDLGVNVKSGLKMKNYFNEKE